MSDSWDEAKYGQYQRQRGLLEEEQDRAKREDAKRIEHHEQMAHDFSRWLERLHYSFEHAVSQSQAGDAASGHQVIENAAEEGRGRLRRSVEDAARLQEEHQREYRRRLDNLEQSYYSGR